MTVATKNIKCQFCDMPGGTKTYEHQVPMPLGGKVTGIDHCIARMVAALNAGGVSTKWCCCGHGTANGIIALLDGRALIILPETPEGQELDFWLDSRGNALNRCDTQENK